MILNTIYISWRKGKGEDRYLIGKLMRLNDSFTFSYIKENCEAAKRVGFIDYPDFSNVDYSQEYTNNLEDTFSLRLMPETRPDRINYLNFWDANNVKYDWFDELGFTQGRLATDNFEFLAQFPYDYKGLKFVTDLAGLSYNAVSNEKVATGDKLHFELDKNNIQDSNAVKVFKDSFFLGYIKKGHNLFFNNANPNRVALTIKHIELNGKVNQIFISVVKK